jgi:hypothetical protein
MKTNLFKAFALFVGFTCIATTNNAQKLNSTNQPSFKTAVGFRVGSTSGLSIKHFVGPYKALEGIVGFWPNAVTTTLLYEVYAPAFELQGLNWYYGAGGHLAFESRSYYNDGRRFERSDRFGVGVDGILGLEYKILPIPFAISLDVKPFVELGTNGNIYTHLDPGLGIKFTF